MNAFTKQVLILILLLAATSAAMFWLVWPGYLAVGGLKEQVLSLAERIKEAEDLAVKIKSLSAKQNTADLSRIMFALPDKRDEAGLLIQLDELAAANGLILTSIGFAPEAKQTGAPRLQPADAEQAPQAGSGQAAPPPLPYKTIGISLALSGSVDAFRNFLRAAENNLRLLDIKSVDFSAAGPEGASAPAEGAQGGEAMAFSVEMETYYK